MMVEQYTHTLIARASQTPPSPAQIQEFIAKLLALGVIPGKAKLELRTKSDRMRTGINPFTGEQTSVAVKNIESISVVQIAHRLAGLHDFELTVAGYGLPKLPPLPREALDEQPYHVGVTILMSSKLRSTSDTYNGFAAPLKDVTAYGEICNTSTTVGYFSNLHNGELIEVADAGASRFWIEFELGKLLFPSLDGGLNILAPEIHQLAERTFSFKMAQGLHWVA